ncbi:hypothetical protein UlMin_015824 [Ulmus minor]
MSLPYRKKIVTRGESSRSNKHKLAKSNKRYDPFPIEKPRKERSNSLKSSLILCGICLDKKAKSEMYSNEDCSHSFCLECLSNYVAAKIRENVIKVKCPDIICKTYLDPRKSRSFVPQQVLDRWEAALCESVLGENKIYCPFNDCSAPLIDDGEELVTSSECPHCHRLFCARCLVPWHAGSACKNKQGNREALVDRKFMELAKKEKWQRCPACNFYVQRKDGCECIKCRCGNTFCYICGSKWHFGHIC